MVKYHEVRRLSNEIRSDRSLPNQNYSQSVVKVMQEKIDFFKSNSGMNSIDYNAISGQLTILNGEQQIICQRDNPNFNLFKEFGVNEEWLRTGVGGENNMFIKLSAYDKAYNRFGYVMENASASKKAALTMLLELVYRTSDEEWDLIMKEIDEIKKGEV